MFFDDSLKGLKKELKTAGVDISFVKGWQKSYDKTKKQYPVLEGQYAKAKSDLEAVMECLKGMEQVIVSANGTDSLVDVKKSLLNLSKDMKKYQNGFNCEFLIGKEDKEFHLTYDTILSLSGKDVKDRKDMLILQSEVENLMAIVKEAQEKEWPEFRAMAYYYLEHTDSEILDLPHSDKIEVVEKIYRNEFYNPMKQVIEAALGEERAKQVMEVDLWI